MSGGIVVVTRAVNWESRDSRVCPGLASPSTPSKDSPDSPREALEVIWAYFKAWKLLYRTRKSTGTRESKSGESTSPKSWTRSSTSSNCYNLEAVQSLES